MQLKKCCILAVSDGFTLNDTFLTADTAMVVLVLVYCLGCCLRLARAAVVTEFYIL
jgi:hypothetical protein